MKAHEAHDVALRGVRLGLVRMRGNPHRRPRVGDPRQQPSVTNYCRTATVAVDFPHDNGSWTSDIASNRWGVREGKLYGG